MYYYPAVQEPKIYGEDSRIVQGKKAEKKIHSQKADMKNGLHSPLVKHHIVKTLGTCDLQLYSYVD